MTQDKNTQIDKHFATQMKLVSQQNQKLVTDADKATKDWTDHAKKPDQITGKKYLETQVARLNNHRQMMMDLLYL